MSCGGRKKSPHTPAIVRISFNLSAFVFNGDILNNMLRKRLQVKARSEGNNKPLGLMRFPENYK